MDDTRGDVVAVSRRWQSTVARAGRALLDHRGVVPRRRVLALAEQMRSQIEAEPEANANHLACADWICWRLRHAPQAIAAHRLPSLSRGHWGGFEGSLEFAHFLRERLGGRRGHLSPLGVSPLPGPVNLVGVARAPHGERGRPNTAFINGKGWKIVARNRAASELFEIHRAWGKLQRRGSAAAWQTGACLQADPMPSALDEGLALRIDALTAPVARAGTGGPQAVVRLGRHPPMRLHLEVHTDRIADMSHVQSKLARPWWQCPMAACSVFIACTETHLQSMSLRQKDNLADHPTLVRLRALRWCLSPIPFGARRHRDILQP